MLNKALSVFIACSYLIINATKQAPVKSNISKYCLTSIGRYRLIILPREFVLVCLQKSILSSVRCNFHYNYFCFCFFFVPSHRRPIKLAISRCAGYVNIGHWEHIKIIFSCLFALNSKQSSGKQEIH